MTNLANELVQITTAAREEQARKAAAAEEVRRAQREAEVAAIAQAFVEERLLHLERLLLQAAKNGASRHEIWKHRQSDLRPSVKDEGVERGMRQVASWLKERGISFELYDSKWKEDEGYSGRTISLTAKWDVPSDG